MIRISKEAAANMTISLMLDNKKCCYCGFDWKSNEDVENTQPVRAYDNKDGKMQFACKGCWDTNSGG